MNKTKRRIMEILSKNKKKYSVKELTNILELDKSTVQRNLKELHEMKMVWRSQMNRTIGGYEYFYELK